MLVLLPFRTSADQLHIAVAANFTAATKAIVPLFEKKTGHTVTVSFGSTGQLFSQIVNGAPFDVLLAADSLRPAALVREGIGIDSTRFTYARGVLALWSPREGFIDTAGTVLSGTSWRYCAFANPKTAPYGAAARQTLQTLKLTPGMEDRLVQGTNIAQTWQQVASGNAELGFVAYAQIALLSPEKKGSYWIVPQDYYSPLLQQAVVLKSAQHKSAAHQFTEFLRDKQALAIIMQYGYGVGESQ